MNVEKEDIFKVTMATSFIWLKPIFHNQREQNAKKNLEINLSTKITRLTILYTEYVQAYYTVYKSNFIFIKNIDLLFQSSQECLLIIIKKLNILV